MYRGTFCGGGGGGAVIIRNHCYLNLELNILPYFPLLFWGERSDYFSVQMRTMNNGENVLHEE